MGKKIRERKKKRERTLFSFLYSMMCCGKRREGDDTDSLDEDIQDVANGDITKDRPTLDATEIGIDSVNVAGNHIEESKPKARKIGRFLVVKVPEGKCPIFDGEGAGDWSQGDGPKLISHDIHQFSGSRQETRKCVSEWASTREDQNVRHIVRDILDDVIHEIVQEEEAKRLEEKQIQQFVNDVIDEAIDEIIEEEEEVKVKNEENQAKERTNEQQPLYKKEPVEVIGDSVDHETHWVVRQKFIKGATELYGLNEHDVNANGLHYGDTLVSGVSGEQLKETNVSDDSSLFIRLHAH